MYDNLTSVEMEFPKNEWEWHRVTSGDEGTMVVASMACLTGKIVFAEARWFSENDGVVLIKKTDFAVDKDVLSSIDTSIKKSNKKPWYKRLLGL